MGSTIEGSPNCFQSMRWKDTLATGNAKRKTDNFLIYYFAGCRRPGTGNSQNLNNKVNNITIMAAAKWIIHNKYLEWWQFFCQIYTRDTAEYKPLSLGKIVQNREAQTELSYNWKKSRKELLQTRKSTRQWKTVALLCKWETKAVRPFALHSSEVTTMKLSTSYPKSIKLLVSLRCS